MWSGALGNHQGGATCFVSLCGGGLIERTVTLPGFWSFAWHLPHFQSLHPFPYATGALPAVSLVFNPRSGGFADVLRLSGPFKWSLLKIQWFLPLLQPPLFFTARSYEALYFWCWNPRLHSLACGWDQLFLGIFPNFYPPHVNVGLLILVARCQLALHHRHTEFSLTFLTVCMNMTSLNPQLSDFQTVQFSGSSGCFLF